MSTSNQYDKFTQFSALCQMITTNNVYTGYFFKVNSGSTNKPLLYDSSSDVDESDITNVSISSSGNLLRTFDPIGNSVALDTITTTDLSMTNCYVGYTYSGKTPNDEPTIDYNTIKYILNGFKGCCKVVYHNVGDTEVRYKYSWIGDTLFKLYQDVFGTTVLISGWATSPTATTPSITDTYPYDLAVTNCFTEEGYGDPVINLYPVVQTYSVTLYAGTQSSAGNASYITLQNESGTVLATGTVPSAPNLDPLISVSGLSSGTYKLVVNFSNPEGIGVYGWRIGHNWVTDITSVSETDLIHNDSGEAYGTVYTFVLHEDIIRTVYINKTYVVKIYSGFDSSNVTMDGNSGSSSSYTNSTTNVTSNSRTVDQLVYPRTYDTWNEPEYASMQSTTRTGYTFKGLRYYASTTPTDYNSGETIPVFPTSSDFGGREYIMLWDQISLNITSKLINYEKTINKKGEEEITEIETIIGKIDTAPSSPAGYDDNVEMETSLAAGIDPISYQNYYQIEGYYEYSGVQSGENGHKLTLLSKGDINLSPSGGTSMTWEFYDYYGNLQTTSGTAFVYDGTNYSLATPGQEIWRPHTETENYFNGWLINGAEDTDNVLGPYTTVNANGTVSLSVPASVLYSHFGTNIELNPRYVTYKHDIGRREYTVQKLTDISGDVYVLLYDESNNNVWKGLLPEVTTGTYGIISTSRGNWSLKYKDSQDKYHLIATSGTYNDNTSGLDIDATISSYVDPPFTSNGDIAGQFKFS